MRYPLLHKILCSLTSICSRLLERRIHIESAILSRVRQKTIGLDRDFVYTVELCAQVLFGGIRKLYATITSLISSTDFWYENIDCSNVNLTIFLDLKKTFDTVNHDILQNN